MADARYYEDRMWEAVESIAKNREIALEWNTITEAKLHKSRLTQVQKQLRLIKKEIVQTKHEINAAYTSEGIGIGKSFGAGIAAGFFGRKTMGKVNASTRNSIRQQQIRAIAPYEEVSRKIDNVLLQFDQLKLQLDSWITEQASKAR
jgi:hypothetical protein